MGKKKLILLAGATLVFLMVIFLPGFSELQKIKEENRQHARRIRLLEESNEKLKKELELLRSDPEYLEKKAREKLGLVRKGEIVYGK